MTMQTKLSTLVRVLRVSLGLLFLQPFSAVAGIITINDLTDTLFVTDTTGRITNLPVPLLCAMTVVGVEQCIIDFAAPAGTVGVTMGGPVGFFNIFEGLNSQTVSDQMEFEFNLQGGMIGFLSDLEDNLTAVPGARRIDEMGFAQNIAGVTWLLNNGSTVTDTIQFASDVHIPEPGTLALLGLGLAGLGFSRHKR